MTTAVVRTELRVPALPVRIREVVSRRISQEHQVDQSLAERMLDSACHFMALAATFPGHSFVPAKSIDSAWHEFILFTRPYRAYCRFLNREYIDHVPVDELEIDPPKGGALRTKRFMEERGIAFDSEMWQLPADADCSADPCNCTGCSEWD